MVWKSVDEIVQGEDSRRRELKSRGEGTVIFTGSWTEVRLSTRRSERTRSNKRRLRQPHEVAVSAAKGV